MHTIAMPPEDVATAVRLRAEHDAVQPVIEQIRSVADALSTHHGDLTPVHALLGRLEGELLPHELEGLLEQIQDRQQARLVDRPAVAPVISCAATNVTRPPKFR